MVTAKIMTFYANTGLNLAEKPFFYSLFLKIRDLARITENYFILRLTKTLQ